MNLATTATAALVAYAQAQCGGEPDLLNLGVAHSALHGESVHWEGDPCATHPSLKLTVHATDGTKRLNVRPSFAPAVRKSTPVTVSVQRGSLTLVTAGTLLQDAVVGQRVQVQNDTTHVALRGVLTGPEQVEIR